ncbi:hypothetical protein E2C01_060030 [Portunus trituberculatus]|uniref:Secreted protein n=1 Tax=Portunus trituberculatus TaxID=210409 RepID=A0A5B7H465_PORTR|nr:hypothetical protein [Portunus trituberculatus]
MSAIALLIYTYITLASVAAMTSSLPPSSATHCNSPSWPVTLEVSVYTNNHHKDEVRLTTLVEETHLDPIQEDDQDRL